MHHAFTRLIRLLAIYSVLATLLPLPAWGRAEPLVLTPSQQYNTLGPRLEYLVDASGKLELAEVMARPDRAFRPVRAHQPAFGYTSAAYWFRFSIDNRAPDTNWILEIDLPTLDSIALYSPDPKAPGGYHRDLTGDRLPFSQRPFPIRDFAFPLRPQPNGTTIYYLRVQTTSSMTLPITVQSDRYFATASQEKQTMHGFYFGFVLALAAYNLMLFLLRIHVSYLFYVMSVVCTGLWQATHSGLGYQYLWSSSVYLENAGVNLFGALAMLGIALFTLRFLEPKRLAPRMAIVLRGLAAVEAVVAVLALAEYSAQTLSYINSILAIVVSLCSIITGILCWYRGQHIARFLVLAQGAWITGILVTMLRALGVLDVQFLSMYGAYLSVPAEMLLLSFALADRYRQMQKQREAAREMVVDTLRNAERELEQRVKERTAALQQANQQLEAANRELDTLNHEKSEFLRIAAHDLKNPIYQIRAGTGLLQARLDDWPKERTYWTLTQLQQITDRMMGIISKLLDLDMIESGKLLLHPAKVSIGDLLRSLVIEARRWAEEKQIQLHLETGDEIDAWLDRGAVFQICENLLSNAIKFSPSHRSVYLRWVVQQGRIRIEIEDEGPGISDSDQGRLFQKFARLSAQPTAGEHSTGLGLSIVKRLATAMGGDVWHERRPGRGACFVVELPAEQSVKAATAA